MLESVRAEGKESKLLDALEGRFEGETAHTKRIVGLFMPLRARGRFAVPLSVGDILSYLGLHGLDDLDCFQWICIADAEAVSWMNEMRAAELEQAKRRQNTSPPSFPRH